MQIVKSKDKSHIVLSLACIELSKKDVSLTFEEGVLTVIGQLGKVRFFRRCIKMPKRVDPSGITATIEKGQIVVKLPLSKRRQLASPDHPYAAPLGFTEKAPLLRTPPNSPQGSPSNTPHSSPPGSPKSGRRALPFPKSSELIDNYYPRYGAMRTQTTAWYISCRPLQRK